MVNLGNDWDLLLKSEFEKDYYKNLRKFLVEEYNKNTIYPPPKDIFNALRFTPYQNVKAVIFGQDPYHGPNQAHGLCFSVSDGVTPPPSLKNIFKEIEDSMGITPPQSGNLTKWAKEGVLLLNTTLTVRAGQPNSHKNKGWETLTDKITELLNWHETPIVFMLWGANAKAKKSLITNKKHLILESVHPSPLSAYGGFFGCGHFKKANQFLEENSITPVNWDLK